MQSLGAVCKPRAESHQCNMLCCPRSRHTAATYVSGRRQPTGITARTKCCFLTVTVTLQGGKPLPVWRDQRAQHKHNARFIDCLVRSEPEGLGKKVCGSGRARSGNASVGNFRRRQQRAMLSSRLFVDRPVYSSVRVRPIVDTEQ